MLMMRALWGPPWRRKKPRKKKKKKKKKKNRSPAARGGRRHWRPAQFCFAEGRRLARLFPGRPGLKGPPMLGPWGPRAARPDARHCAPGGPGLDPLMLMMRALWGPPWRCKKPRQKKTVHRRHAGVGGTGVRPTASTI